MKCSECAEYKDCSRKYDLRIRRKRCGKTDTAKYVVMEEGGMTKDEITTPLPEAATVPYALDSDDVRDGNTIKLPRKQEKNEWND